jgi:Holliday junction DNA helicase RuvA
MIALLRGRLRRRFDDRVVVECAGVGYEVYLPPVTVKGLSADDEVELAIHYHATRDQPRPVLIGFVSDLEREFFERLITVTDVGPMVAARALVVPVPELAAAIARADEKYLRQLPGIGPQKAKNIVAQLQAKVAKFALAQDRRAGSSGEGGPEGQAYGVGAPAAATSGEMAPDGGPARHDATAPAGVLSGAAMHDATLDDVRSLVWEVLVKQLGHRPSEASRLISGACERRPGITTPEELFDEIYRGGR